MGMHAPEKVKPASNAAKPATETKGSVSVDNTTKQADAAAVTNSSDADGDENSGETRGRRGVVPTMPAAIVYRLANRVYAAIHHPGDGSSYTESGKGEGSAKGALEDSGFRLGSLTLDGPEWLSAKLPANATLIGYATIKGFPLPPQDPATK